MSPSPDLSTSSPGSPEADTVDQAPPQPFPEHRSVVDGYALTYSGASVRGLVRETNEDAFLARHAIFAVADGMGGHESGEVASKRAIDLLAAAFPIFPRKALDARTDLVSALLTINAAIYADQAGRVLRGRMGTTVTAGIIVERQLAFAHVGDSRLYHVRGRRLLQVTQDHTRPPFRNVLDRAVGTHPEVEVDAYVLELEPRDVLLFTTDGITNHLDDKSLAALLVAHPSPGQAVAEILDGYMAMGAEDNGTAVVVRIEGAAS